VFTNEARNAMNRYNREKHSGQNYPVAITPINGEIKFLLIGPFSNAQGAIDYVQGAKSLAPTQILPWLKADKYSFSIISGENLRMVTEKGDYASYALFLDQNLPVKF
jgi:hypothetical protein